MNRKNKPTAQTIYETLKDMIIRCEIAPGNRITEGEVSSYFEVGRTPDMSVSAWQKLAWGKGQNATSH